MALVDLMEGDPLQTSIKATLDTTVITQTIHIIHHPSSIIHVIHHPTNEEQQQVQEDQGEAA